MKALIIFSFVPALAADLDQAEAQPSFGDQPTLTTSGRCATNSVALRLEWSQFYRGLTKGEGDRKCKYWPKMGCSSALGGLWQGLSAAMQGTGTTARASTDSAEA